MPQKPLKFEQRKRLRTNEPSAAEQEGRPEIPQRMKTLGIIGVVLLVVIAGVVVWQGYRADANRDASNAVAAIVQVYQQGDFQEAIDGTPAAPDGTPARIGLAEIVSEYSSTDAGRTAAFLLGNSYLALEDLPKAKAAYEIASDSDDELIRSGGLAGLAAVAEAGNDHASAADLYADAAEAYKAEFKTPEYLLGAARNYEQAGQTAEAIELYRRIATQYSTSAANTEARLALARNNQEL